MTAPSFTSSESEFQINLALLAGEVLRATGCANNPTIEDLRQARAIVDCAAAYIFAHDPTPPDEVFTSLKVFFDYAAKLGWLDDPDWVRRTSEGPMVRIPSTAFGVRTLN
jgi:hypothetical protein